MRIPGGVRDLRDRSTGPRGRVAGLGGQRELFRAGTPQDVTSVRAKSQRHRKSTADRWNQ